MPSQTVPDQGVSGRKAEPEHQAAGADTAPLRTIVVLQTHFYNKSIARLFAGLAARLPDGYAAMVLMHVAPGTTPKPDLLRHTPHHFVTTPEIRNPAYPRKSNGPGWGIWRGGHTDLIALSFFSAHPDYERYWFVEYDVRFSGRWNEFFTFFDADPADFLSTSMRRMTDQPEWMHWPTLQVPADAGTIAAADRLASFMPVYRVSRRALETIDRAYRDGWGGHCEVAWATIVNWAGLTVEDLGGDGEFVAPGNRTRFYSNTVKNEALSPGSLVFRPVRSWTGSHRNWLWHPVKPLHFKLREDVRRAWMGAKPYLQRLRRFIPAHARTNDVPVNDWPGPATPDPSRRSR